MSRKLNGLVEGQKIDRCAQKFCPHRCSPSACLVAVKQRLERYVTQ
jgi:hypothetical protein